MHELELAYRDLCAARRPEDVFGWLAAGETAVRLQQLDGAAERLAAVVDPSRFDWDLDLREIATAAATRLADLRRQARTRIELGVYGRDGDDPAAGLRVELPDRVVVLESTIGAGDLATVYGGRCDGPEPVTVAVKIANDPADHDLMQQEARVLRRFQANPGSQSKHLPELLATFKTADGRLGLVLRYLDGIDLVTLRERFPDGVPAMHAIWICARVLSAIGFAHRLGVVHGNVEPTHILVRPRDHNAFLIDWSYAAIEPDRSGERFRVRNDEYSAPEVGLPEPPTPAADIFSIGKCMVYILGGDVATGALPADVDARLQRFLQAMMLASSRQRPRDAWELHSVLKSLRGEIFGQTGFLELNV
ncbi:MAG: protein kinase [Candidatus Schekmanbacteria bacterium]|nr:protein kinase [Candidatus Schekmanbacteria bacterium]